MRQFKSISEFHEYLGLPAPLHPLLSVLDVGTVPHRGGVDTELRTLNFYCIAVKRMVNFKGKYGQQPFDFDQGVMSFMGPNQAFSVMVDDENKPIRRSGWVIYIHPDFFWNTPLAASVRRYDFWDYSLREGLFLSEAEEALILGLVANIDREYRSNIDQYSKPIITTHIESLLNYANRFYHRQFITREKVNHQLLDRMQTILTAYFDQEDLAVKGLPGVTFVAQELNVSPRYLGSMLKVLTGMNAQQHIHEKLIEKAKEQLSLTGLSIGEIAFALGFEHLASFSRLFKAKTSLSPQQFRASFN